MSFFPSPHYLKYVWLCNFYSKLCTCGSIILHFVSVTHSPLNCYIVIYDPSPCCVEFTICTTRRGHRVLQIVVTCHFSMTGVACCLYMLNKYATWLLSTCQVDAFCASHGMHVFFYQHQFCVLMWEGCKILCLVIPVLHVSCHQINSHDTWLNQGWRGAGNDACSSISGLELSWIGNLPRIWGIWVCLGHDLQMVFWRCTII